MARKLLILASREPIPDRLLAGASILLVVTAALARWLPARRAARIDPVEVLKQD